MAVGSLNVELMLDTSDMIAALRESQERLASLGRETSRQMAIVRTEFGTAVARMDDATDSTERLQVQQESLGQRLQQQRTYLEALNETYQQSIQVYGQNSEESQRLAVRLARAQETEANLERQIRETNRQLQEQANSNEHTMNITWLRSHQIFRIRAT
jgi:chromosome segregation ATPase